MVEFSSVVDAGLVFLGVMAVLGMGLGTSLMQTAQPSSITLQEKPSTCEQAGRAA